MRAAVKGPCGDGPRARGVGTGSSKAARAAGGRRGRRDAVAVGAVFFFLRWSIMSGRDKINSCFHFLSRACAAAPPRHRRDVAPVVSSDRWLLSPCTVAPSPRACNIAIGNSYAWTNRQDSINAADHFGGPSAPRMKFFFFRHPVSVVSIAPDQERPKRYSNNSRAHLTLFTPGSRGVRGQTSETPARRRRDPQDN